MQRFGLLTASAVLALGLGISGSANAAITIDAVTVDGGATTTVLPGGTIEVKVTVSSGVSSTNWGCTEYQIETQSVVDVGHGPHNTNPIVGEMETFNITAPAVAGEYDLDIDIWSNGGCSNDNNSLTLTDAIEVLEAAAEVNDIVKTLEAGPTDELGDDILFAPEFGLGGEPSPDSNDDGVIGIGLDFEQHFRFSITITDVADGTVVYDVVPAEYNLDPDLQDITDLGGNGASCDPGGATDCTADDDTCHDVDGIVIPCNGVAVAGDCTATPRQPPNSQGGRFKEPELLTIIVGDDGGGDATCTINVFVVTDGNPGHWVEDGPPPVFTLYEPTSCTAFRDPAEDLLEDGDGDPIVDSIALNDGFKDFDPATGDRISGPRGSLQLTPVGCDSDDDGVIDELDACPIDGPPEEGQVEDDPGCWGNPV